jgi:hypothetical protein
MRVSSTRIQGASCESACDLTPSRLPTVTLVGHTINSSIQCVARRGLGSDLDAVRAPDPTPNNSLQPDLVGADRICSGRVSPRYRRLCISAGCICSPMNMPHLLYGRCCEFPPAFLSKSASIALCAPVSPRVLPLSHAFVARVGLFLDEFKQGAAAKGTRQTPDPGFVEVHQGALC